MYIPSEAMCEYVDELLSIIAYCLQFVVVYWQVSTLEAKVGLLKPAFLLAIASAQKPAAEVDKQTHKENQMMMQSWLFSRTEETSLDIMKQIMMNVRHKSMKIQI